MNKLKLASIASLLIVIACTSTPKEEVSEKIEALNSDYPALNEVSKNIAQSKSNAEKLPLLVKRAHWYLDHDFFSDVQSDAAKINGIDSNSAYALALVALVNIEQGNFLDAKNKIDFAKQREKGKDEAIYAEAELQFAGKQLGKSLETVNKALEINQYLYRGYYLKGRIYLQAGDTAKAVSSIRTAVELNPDFYRGFKLLALTYAGADDNLFKQYIDAAERVEPKNPEAKFMQADFNYRKGNMQLAKNLYHQSLALDSNYEFSHFNLGVIYLSEDLALDSALSAFKRCVEIAPSYTNAWYNMGICYQYMDSTDEAKNAFEKTLSINPSYAPAQEALEEL